MPLMGEEATTLGCIDIIKYYAVIKKKSDKNVENTKKLKEKQKYMPASSDSTHRSYGVILEFELDC